jgi:hypothetical protein
LGFCFAASRTARHTVGIEVLNFFAMSLRLAALVYHSTMSLDLWAVRILLAITLRSLWMLRASLASIFVIFGCAAG